MKKVHLPPRKLAAAAFLAAGLCVSTVSANTPVFDASNFMQAIDRFYALYDQINIAIEQAQNAKEQLENAKKQAENFKFDDNPDLSDWGAGAASTWKNIGVARDRMKEVNGYLSEQAEKLNDLKNSFNADVFAWGGKKYNIADLLGFGEEGKNMFSLGAAISKDVLAIGESWEKELTYKEKERIWKKYGMSPRVFHALQVSEGVVKDATLAAAATLSPGARKKLNEEISQQAAMDTLTMDQAVKQGSMSAQNVAIHNVLVKGNAALHELKAGLLEFEAVYVQEKAKQAKLEDAEKEREILNERKTAARLEMYTKYYAAVGF